MGIFNFLKNKTNKDTAPKTEHYFEMVKWIDSVLSQSVPEEVVAFCFNLYDDGDNRWSIEIVGTNYFNKKDVDWPCYEIIDFGTRENPFMWMSDMSWDKVLNETELILNDYLQTGKYAQVLKSKKAVATGFVDGDTILLYKK